MVESILHISKIITNRFAVCLGCSSPELPFPNCLSIFLRLQFTGIFYVSRMANSICLSLLDFNIIYSSALCRGQLAPCTPRRAEPARPQLPAARILQPISKKSSKNHSTNCNPFQHRNQTPLSTIPCFSPVDKFPEIAYNKERTHRTIVCKEVRQCCPLYTVKNHFRLPCPVWQAANGLHKVFYFMEMPD